MEIYVVQGLVYLIFAFIVLIISGLMIFDLKKNNNKLHLLLLPGSILNFLWLLFSALQSFSTSVDVWLIFNTLVYTATVPFSTYILYMGYKMYLANRKGVYYAIPNIRDIYFLFPFLFVNMGVLIYLFLTIIYGNIPNLWLLTVANDHTTGYGIFREVHGPLWYFHMLYSAFATILFLTVNSISVITTDSPIVGRYSYYLALTSIPAIISGLLLYFIITGLSGGGIIIDTTPIGIALFFLAYFIASSNFHRQISEEFKDPEAVDNVYNIVRGRIYHFHDPVGNRNIKGVIRPLLDIMRHMGWNIITISTVDDLKKFAMDPGKVESTGSRLSPLHRNDRILFVLDLIELKEKNVDMAGMAEYMNRIFSSVVESKHLMFILSTGDINEPIARILSITSPIYPENPVEKLRRKMEKMMDIGDIKKTVIEYSKKLDLYHFYLESRKDMLNDFWNTMDDYYSSIKWDLDRIERSPDPWKFKREYRDAIMRLKEVIRINGIIKSFEMGHYEDILSGHTEMDRLIEELKKERGIHLKISRGVRSKRIPVKQDFMEEITLRAFIPAIKGMADGDVDISIQDSNGYIVFDVKFSFNENIILGGSFYEYNYEKELLDFISETPMSVPMSLYNIHGINEYLGSGLYLMRRIVEIINGEWRSSMDPPGITIKLPVAQS